MSVRGSKEWAPLERRLLKRTVETPVSINDEHRLGNAALPADDAGGPLAAWHVTDEPEQMEVMIAENRDLQALPTYLDACGGLVVSGAPQLYARGAERQWDFLKELAEEDRRRLADLIIRDALEKRSTHYITSSEFDRVHDNVYHWMETGNDVFLRTISGQPFNINIQIMAKEAGIGEPAFPSQVRVIFEGKYLDMTDHFENDPVLRNKAAQVSGISEAMLDREDICRFLAHLGYDGTFTKSGFASFPGLTIWNADRILEYGEWKR